MIRVLCIIVYFLHFSFLWANDTIPENKALTSFEPSEYEIRKETSNDKLLVDNFRKEQLIEIEAASQRIEDNRKKLQSFFDVKVKENNLVELRIANNVQRSFQLKLRNNLLLASLLTTIGLMAIILLVIVRNKRELKLRAQQVSRASFNAREKEKMRFSRELHDDFQSTLSIIHIMATHEFTHAPENKNYETIAKKTKTAMNVIRNISKDLYPTEIKTQGLLESLKSLIERTNARQMMTVFHLLGDDFECTSELRMTWYRIVQKLMNNTLNASKAQDVTIVLRIKANGIELVYTESNYEQKGASSEFHLGSVRELIHSLGGELSINNQANSKCEIIVFFEEKHLLNAIKTLK
jgi:signal transduction histidine kinase